MKKITTRMCNGGAREEDVDLLHSISMQISGRTICAHGEACAWPTESVTKKFKDEFLAKAKNQKEGLEEQRLSFPLI